MMEIKVRKNSFYAYIAMTLAFMGCCSVFQGTTGSLQWKLAYYGSPLVLVALSIYYISLNSDIRIRHERKLFIKLFCMPRVIMLLYSCILWLISKTAVPYISRGVSNTLFQCVAYICGVCIACGEKDDILDITLASSITVFAISYLIGFVQNGMFFVHALNPFDPLAYDYAKYTELHEIAYILGLSILLNLIIEKHTSLKKKNVLFWISIVFFVIAWKRIGIFAVAVTYLYFQIFDRSNKTNKSIFIKITGIIGTIVCLVFVSLIVSGEFVGLLQSYGIDMMGRDIIYAYFRRFTTFSPTFMGKGVGFVGRQFDYTTSADLYHMASIRALHNDFFKMYIEIGFIGFIIWVVWWLIKLPQIIKKRYGVKKAFICLLFILFAFILYTTDNTESYNNFQMELSSIITYISIFYYDRRKTSAKES